MKWGRAVDGCQSDSVFFMRFPLWTFFNTAPIFARPSGMCKSFGRLRMTFRKQSGRTEKLFLSSSSGLNVKMSYFYTYLGLTRKIPAAHCHRLDTPQKSRHKSLLDELRCHVAGRVRQIFDRPSHRLVRFEYSIQIDFKVVGPISIVSDS